MLRFLLGYCCYSTVGNIARTGAGVREGRAREGGNGRRGYALRGAKVSTHEGNRESVASPSQVALVARHAHAKTRVLRIMCC